MSFPFNPNQGGFGYWTHLSNSSNNYTANAVKALANCAADPHLFWAGIHVKGENDVITRDRSGGYALGPAFTDFAINGGSGTDTVSHELASTGLEADLWTGLAKTANGGGKIYKTDQLNSIENLTGTNCDDVIVDSGDANTLKGLNGNDYITVASGDDSIEGGAHRDLLYGEGGNDTIDGGGSNDLIDGGSGDDDLTGGWGNDQIVLGTGDDEAWGESGSDIFYIGGSGDNDIDGGHDFVVTVEGDNTVNVGGGNDTV